MILGRQDTSRRGHLAQSIAESDFPFRVWVLQHCLCCDCTKYHPTAAGASGDLEHSWECINLKTKLLERSITAAVPLICTLTSTRNCVKLSYQNVECGMRMYPGPFHEGEGRPCRLKLVQMKSHVFNKMFQLLAPITMRKSSHKCVVQTALQYSFDITFVATCNNGSASS